MAENADILTQAFEQLKTDLIAKHDEKGMRASGKWADSLEVQTKDNSAMILGLPYSQQLETGREPGKAPPSSVIEKWIVDKGIASRIEGNISISSLAFLIARKIAREGWKREDHGGVELLSEVITAQRMQEIIDAVGEAKIIEFSTGIIDFIKTELQAA